MFRRNAILLVSAAILVAAEIPAITAAATNRNPGSDTDGMPASVTNKTLAPPRSSSTNSAVRATSLASK